MKVETDRLKIQALSYDVDGRKLEVEEIPAERRLGSTAEVSGNLSGTRVGTIPVAVTIQGTVGMFANKLRTQCASCIHFNNSAFLTWKAKLEGIKEGVALLNGMRWELQVNGLGPSVMEAHRTIEDEFDIENCLNVMGICRALTEQHKEEVIVHPLGGCPPEVCTEQSPLGFFEPRSDDLKRLADRAYDSVMRNAQDQDKPKD